MSNVRDLLTYKRKAKLSEREIRLLKKENLQLKRKVKDLEKYKRWAEHTIRKSGADL